MNDFLSDLDNELDNMTANTKVELSDKKTQPTVNKKVEPKKIVKSNTGAPLAKKTVVPVAKKAPYHNKGNYRNNGNDSGYITKNPSNFPEVKFYLPTLRDGYTRFMPIG